MAENTIIRKILEADNNTYIIFYTPECSYSQKALELLRKSSVKYKGYNINDINGGMQKLLEVLNSNSTLIAFNSNHRTRPIIFFDHLFIGGYNELVKKLTE